MRRWLIAALVSVGVFGALPILASATQDSTSLLGTLANVQEPAASETNITYNLAWDWGNATALADGGWTTQNDLGYTITIEEGYTIAYSLQMVECEHSHDDDEPNSHASVLDAFMPTTAEAGHGGDVDASAVTTGILEDLTNPQSQIFGDAAIDYQVTYCEAHYLVAKGNNRVAEAPSQETSLYLRGTFQAPDNDQPIAFEIETNLANGNIMPLQVTYIDDANAHVHLRASGQDASIVITRHLDTLFDGINFDTIQTDDLGRAILWALIDNAEVTILEGETFVEISEAATP